jgi:hypothetical protein
MWASAAGGTSGSGGNEGTDSVGIGPRLTIPGRSFDFGYVPQHAIVSHEFWLHSTGDDSLRVLKINPC